MRTRLLIIFSLIIISVSAEESKIESLTTTDGKTYKSVSIMKVTPSEIRIIHSSGATAIPFERLPLELQKKYNYDPDKATAYKTKVAKANATYRKNQAEAAALTKLKKSATHQKFFVLNVLDGALLVNNVDYISVSRYLNGSGRVPKAVRGSKVFYVVGYPKSKDLTDDSRIEGYFYKNGTFSYTTALNTKATVAKYFYVGAKKKKR